MQKSHIVLGIALWASCGSPTEDAQTPKPSARQPVIAGDAAPTAPEASIDAVPAALIDAAVDAAPDATIRATAIDAATGARPDAGAQRAKHGEVCRSGETNPTPIERACEPGLECCYPCGTRGCDFVCHTKRECELDKRRP